MTDDFTPKNNRRRLLPRAKLAAGTSVLPSAWGTLISRLQDAEAIVPSAILTVSPQNVSRVVQVRSNDLVAGTSMSNKLVSVSRNFWSNSIPETKLQPWRSLLLLLSIQSCQRHS